MNTVFGALSRSAALRTAPLALRRPVGALPRLSVTPRMAAAANWQVRTSTSGRPASQTIGEAAQNIKEEVGNSASDIARSIAGGTLPEATVGKPGDRNFVGITKALATTVPTPYLLFGLAGGLPYVGASATTVYLSHQAGQAASGVLTNIDPGVALTVLDQALNLQVTYGAVMLSFLGALHWGMEFAGYGGHKYTPRLLLGIAPVVAGWSTLALQPTFALIWQWVSFTALWYADSKATGLGWTPKWYSQYRFYLSILVGTCIIGSLAGTNYWGPVAGHGMITRDLVLVRAERQKLRPESAGYVSGDVEALDGCDDADHYVILKSKASDGEESGEEGAEEGGEGEDKE